MLSEFKINLLMSLMSWKKIKAKGFSALEGQLMACTLMTFNNKKDEKFNK